MRAIVVAAVLARSAAAEPVPVPGGGDDPVRELDGERGIVETADGLSIHGGAPEDTVVLVDGFAVPSLYHVLGVRSIVTTLGFQPIAVRAGGFDAAYGRGSSVIELRTRRPRYRKHYYADLMWSRFGLLASAAADSRFSTLAITYNIPPLIGDVSLARDRSLAAAPRYFDWQSRSEFAITREWRLTISGIGAEDQNALVDTRVYTTTILRGVVAAFYYARPWTATIAASVMDAERGVTYGDQHASFAQLALDTRIDVTRSFDELAGLTRIAWRFGEQTDSSRYDLDVAWSLLPREGFAQATTPNPSDRSTLVQRRMWRHDLAAWTSLAANLAPSIRAEAGVRVDAFGTYVTTQPRGSLDISLGPHTAAILLAGAYRRPPEQLDELVDGTLHPERATHVIARAVHALRKDIGVVGELYYIDRTRLVIRDALGLHNSGFGTSYGINGEARLTAGPWSARLALSLASSTRLDHLRAAERPFQYDQPVQLDALASWRHGAWQLGGRFRLASGLPDTPVTGVIYDSDHDYYQPLFGETYSQRMPLRHRLDLRVDRSFTIAGVHLAAFLDLHNAYASRSVVDYAYSFDYRERSPLYALPVFPYLGLRGDL